MEMYTIIYSFMSFSLGLSGATKEVFAVIYGFWKSKRAPVAVPNSVIRAITGLSHSSIVDAKNKLVTLRIIIAHEFRGKPSLYEVCLPPDLSGILTPPESVGEGSGKRRGPGNEPKVNINNTSKNKNKNKTSYYGNRSLNVADSSEFTGPDKL